MLPSIPFIADLDTAVAKRASGSSSPAFGASIGTPISDIGNQLTSIARSGVTVPAGALVVVGVSWYGDSVTATLADNGPGLTWVKVVQRNGVGDGSRHIAIFAAIAPAGLSNATLTATFSSAAFGRAIFGAYFTGAVATLDTSAGNSGTPTAPTAIWSPGAVTTTAGTAVVVSALWLDGGWGSNAPAANATEAVDFNDGSFGSWVLAYRIVSAPGTYDVGGTLTYTDTNAGEEEWVAAVAAFGA